MSETLRFGVYGLRRGLAHIKSMEVLDGVEVAAICDMDPAKVEAAKQHCPADVRVCRDYDELLDSGIDAVVLANFLPDHCRDAIKALKKGIAVVSECLAAATMKECVDLVEAVEETGVYYSMAENSPYMRSCLEMGRIYQSGVLGNVVCADGEYCHPAAPVDSGKYSPTPDHWRKKLPRTYYLTHSLGPLMNMTRLMPKKVIGKVARGPGYAKRRNSENEDNAGVMLVEMEGGAIFRITGHVSYGPHTHWFRLACENGGVENVRTDEQAVSLALNPWDVPEEMRAYGANAVYHPLPDYPTRKAQARGLSGTGHLEDDFRTVHNYVTELREKKVPDMDVYRSVSMSAVAILGWRSVLHGGKEYDIPDFKDKAARDAYRSDDLSPWRNEIPCAVYTVKD